MEDVNEWSSEYNIKVGNFIDLAESPHSWDKRVLNITPIKDGKNYRFRLGLQMFPMKTNETYSLIIELYNRDFKTWERQETYINGTGLWVKSSNTAKFQHQYGSSGDLYYSRSLIKFKKTSSSAPIFVYFTVHFDDKGGDMNTYPKDFKNQVYIVAYGIVGETDHVNPEVYDSHKAFEIDKTKMKMLVPLDMNNNAILNTKTPVHDLNPANKKYVDDSIRRFNNTTNIYIYGMVDSNKYFTSSSMRLRLRNINITYKILSTPAKYTNSFDSINITSVFNTRKFSFMFPSKPGEATIQINQYFSSISHITMEHGINIPFQIIYSVFY